MNRPITEGGKQIFLLFIKLSMSEAFKFHFWEIRVLGTSLLKQILDIQMKRLTSNGLDERLALVKSQDNHHTIGGNEPAACLLIVFALTQES
jgi:hypothetical protein